MVTGIHRSFGPVSRSSQKNISRRIHVVRRAADKNSSNIKARLFMARDLVRNGERKNEQWAVEKPKLDVLVSLIQKTWKFREKRADNAGIASGSSHLGAEKLMAKTNPMYCISGNVCFVEPLESTGKRLERTLPKDHEDRIAGKGFNWLGHHNLVHKFMPMHQAMQIPDAEAAVEEGVGKARKFASMANDQSKEQKQKSFWKHENSKEQSILPRRMVTCW